MKTFRRHPGAVLGVIAFALISLVLTGMVAGTLSNATRGPTVRISAEFRDATGVAVGDDVRMAGVKVGRVVDTQLKGSLALITFDVETSQEVTTSALAGIDYLNLMGQRYISLEPGAGAPGTRPLRAGETIGVEKTRGALDLTTMFNAFKPLFDTLRPGDINELAENIVAVLQGEGNTLAKLIQQTAELTSSVVDRDEVIARVLDNLTLVSETANSHRTEIVALVTQLGTLTEGLAKDRVQIATALDDLHSLTTAGENLLAATGDPIARDLRALAQFSAYLAEQDPLLGSTVKNTPLQLGTYIRTLGYGSHLNVYVCQLYLQAAGGPKVDSIPGGRSSQRCK